ncbi:MAG TPA: PAS domain-containing protein [Candidatus Paceibacterota bacterium]
MNTQFLNEQRCKCGKLLLKGIFFDGALEIKCKKCGTINKIGSTKLADDDIHYSLFINDKGNIINASTSACKILGYKHEELIGLHFTKINTIVSKDINDKLFRPESMLNEDNYFQLDTIHQSKSGNKIPVTVIIKLYQPTLKERFLLISAELKKTEDNTKTNINKDEDYINNACDFYFDIDKNGTLDYISPTVENFFRFIPEAAIGKNYFECIPIGNRKESKKLFEYFSKDEKAYKTEDTACLSTNGNTLYTELFFTPKFNDMGKFIGYRILVWATIKS